MRLALANIHMDEIDLIEFEWWRCLDGYRLIRSGLESASDRFERYRPLDTPALFALFANSSHTPDGMLQFCNQFGLLGGGRPDITRPNGKPTFEAVIVDELLRHHAYMRGALNLFEKGDVSRLVKAWNETVQALALVRLELRPAADGRLRLVWVPPDLIGAMWHQFALHACAGNQLFRCLRCGKPFIVGTGTGRRKTAMYCSNACKVAAYQARQREES